MSVLTTTPLKSAPTDIGGVAIPTITAPWVSTAWVEVIPATAFPTAIAGFEFTVAGGTFSQEMWELDVGVGIAGSEVVVGTLRLLLNNSGAIGTPKGLLLPVPMGGIAAGVRVAVRARCDTPSSGWGTVALQYCENLSSDQVTTAAQVLTSAPAGNATQPTVTPSATPWANSPWTEAIHATATPIGLLGLTWYQHSGFAAPGGIEYDIGIGAAGSETVVTTLRQAWIANAAYFTINWLPAPYPVPAGTRVSVRTRKDGTHTTVEPFALLYYTNVSAAPPDQAVTGATLASIATLFPPTVAALPPAQGVTTAALASTALLRAPSVALASAPQTITGPTHARTSVVYAPMSITVGTLPPNTTPATAIDLGTLPASYTQTVTGATYVWYRYTAQPGDDVLGIEVTGVPVDNANPPYLTIYTDTTGWPDGTALIDGLLAFLWMSTQFPVAAGTTYYFMVQVPPGAPVLHVSLLRAPHLAFPNGALAINDDTQGLPLAILSPTDGSVLQFQNALPTALSAASFPNAPSAAVLPNGRSLWGDEWATPYTFYLYDAAFTLLATVVWVPPTTDTFYGLVCTNRRDRFYLVSGGTVYTTNFSAVTTLSEDGILGPIVWMLPVYGVGAIAVSPDESTLYYYAGQTYATIAVSRFDLVGNVALPPLVAQIDGYAAEHDLIVLADGTLLVGFDGSGSIASAVHRYAPDGTLVATYDLGLGTFPLLVAGLDDPLSFWVWTQRPPDLGGGWSRFFHVRVSDGAVLATLDAVQYESGSYAPSDVPAPAVARFGHSEGGAFVLLYVPLAVTTIPLLSNAACFPPMALLDTGDVLVCACPDDFIGSDD